MRQTRAFSFVEILIAATCLVVVMIPLTSMFSMGSTGTNNNRNEIFARQYMLSLFNFIKVLSYDDNFLDVGKKSINRFHFRSGAHSFDMKVRNGFERKISIEEVKTNNWRYKYKLIKVSVEWKESKKRIRKLQISGVKVHEN
jgi:hypothetical protein